MNKPVYIVLLVVLIVLTSVAGWMFFSSKQTVIQNEVIKVISSHPLGVSQGQSAANGVRLAFEQANYKAGKYTVELITLDDGSSEGNWDPILEEKNANLAANDPNVVVYLGPQNSGAAKISIPILNKAGIVQISEANTWPGLTKPGFAPGEPGIFYPTGIRTYFRVVTTDDLQGPAGAIWAQSLGYKTVYILDDGEVYGKGVADLFKTKYNELGLTVLNQETINKSASDFTPLVKKIITMKPDIVYFGGAGANGAFVILDQLRKNGYKGAFMGPDGLSDKLLIEQIGKNAEGIYITDVGIPVTSIGNDKSKKFYSDYITRFKTTPELNGAYTYETARLVLKAIEENGNDKKKILKSISGTRNFDSMFGPMSFDKNGDIEQKNVIVSTVKNGKLEFIKRLPLP